MSSSNDLARIAEEKRRWEETTVRQNLERIKRDESPFQLYTPADDPQKDYLRDVGFPGEYPFTRGTYAVPAASSPYGARGGGGGGVINPRAGTYAGYGLAEDTRDLWRVEGRRGANVAFDLPTQCGYDSDNAMAEGEVGRTGVCIDSLQDFETLYEAFDGVVSLDEMASNFTINAPCNIILAMYFALAEGKGIPLDALRGTPQNDILKEFVARGTYIFAPGPSMRMFRDTVTFGRAHARRMNVVSICGYHMYEAGASDVQASAYAFTHAKAYIDVALRAGLDVDDFIRRYTFLDFGHGMDFWREIARARANRRIWARITREVYGCKSPGSWILRGGDSIFVGPSAYTLQRPLNNLVRGVVGGVMGFLGTGFGGGGIPWDEALGLGHSYEARQLSVDAGRILRHEARLGQVLDPLAGSYFVESLTDQVEEEILEIMRRIEDLGGAVPAIESGHVQSEIARSAHQRQRDLEEGRQLQVGVNAYTDSREMEVVPPREIPHPYDQALMANAEERQCKKLKDLRGQRSAAAVNRSLATLGKAAEAEDENLIPYLIEAVKAYATVGEICDVLRDVFGEYRQPSAI